MTTPTVVDYSRFLTTPFQSNQFWTELAGSLTNVLNAQVDDPRRELGTVRDAPEDTDRVFLMQNVNNLGFTYRSEFFGTGDYSRLQQFISLYYNQNGTGSFVKFMGYIKNTQFDAYQLWTDNFD